MRQIGRSGWITIGVVTALIIGLGIMLRISLPAAQPTNETPERVLSVGTAIGRGGLGDRSFNDSANEGLQRAQTELGARVRIVELERDTQEAILRTLAGEGHDIVIALGQEYTAALATVAPEFPDQHFAIIDAQVDLPNVTSVTFSELEGDFLAGALAALLSESGTVGFLGGADIGIIRRIEHGWSQGVRYINPEATILAEYAGGVDDFSGFAKPELGMELSTEMYSTGADVVYAAAGRTALGAIDAAAREGGIVITTGSDQRYLNPDVVATSRTKNMDVAVYTVLSELQRGELAPGHRVLDLASDGVGLAELGDPLISPEIAARIETIRQDLNAGTITVEQYTTE